MRYSLALRALSVAGLAALAACSSDMPSAPVAAPLDVASPSLAKGGSGKDQAPETYTLTINTAQSKVHFFGQNWVYIPAGAVCEAGTEYSESVWDTDCTPATGTVTIDVTVRAEQGYPMAEFAQDVVFSRGNSTSWRDWVILGLKVQGNLNRKLGYGILYRPTGGSRWIDEAATDGTLKAWRAPGNVIARRLKHFSGYNVALGFDEQEDPSTGIGGAQ